VSDVHDPGQVAAEPEQTNGEQVGVPAPVTLTHVPTLPDLTHVSQLPPHAELQQTLSTQAFDVHSLLAPQACPLALRPEQVPVGPGVWQKLPPTQSGSPAQTLTQLADAPLHRYGAQLGLPCTPSAINVHEPVEQESHAPEHAVLQHFPSAQKPVLHSFAPEHADPLLFLAEQVVPPQ
jgi:hypothetical protein